MIVYRITKDLAIAIIVSFFVVECCKGHSYLIRPAPISWWCKGCLSCRNVEESKLSLLNIDKTWKRGEIVEIKWVKNNHNGGFVRLSIVPLERIYDSVAHRKFAFYYGCWEQGLFLCGKHPKCGSDTRGMAFQRNVSVPNVIPDGVYVFAFMWFGGIHYERKHGRFAHFTSCSIIKVKGGLPLQKKYKKLFQPGNVGKFESNGLCLTSTAIEGQCLKGCTQVSSFYSIPGLFKPTKGKPKDLYIDSTEYIK